MADGARLSALFRKIIQRESLDKADLADITAYGSFSFTTLQHTTSVVEETSLESGCKCAFEHEYFDYVDTTGVASPDTVNTICESIEKNRCAHVSDVSEDTAVTSVSALHVAIAVDYQVLFTRLPGLNSPSRDLPCIFHLSHLQLAMVKQRYTYIENNAKEKHPGLATTFVVYMEPSEDGSTTHIPTFRFTATHLTFLKLSVYRNDVKMIKILVQNPIKCYILCSSIGYSIDRSTFCATRVLLAFLRDKNELLVVEACCADKSSPMRSLHITSRAVLNNDTKTLEFLANHSLISDITHINSPMNCLDLAKKLQYKDFVRILNTCMSPLYPEMDASQDIFSLIIRLTFRTPKLCCKLLHRLVDTGHDINCVDRRCGFAIFGAIRDASSQSYSIVKTLIELGSDLNKQNADQDNVLLNLLNHEQFLKMTNLAKAILHYHPVIPHFPKSYEYMRRAVIIDSTPPNHNRDTWWKCYDRPASVADSSTWRPEDSVTVLLWECGYPIPADIITTLA